MKKNEYGKYIMESTGRKSVQHYDVVSIDKIENLFIVSVDSKRRRFWEFDKSLEGAPEYEFTKQERKELADYMISLWTKFRDQE